MPARQPVLWPERYTPLITLMEPVVLFAIMAQLLFGQTEISAGPVRQGRAFFLAWMLAMFAMGKVWSAIFGRPFPSLRSPFFGSKL